MRGGWRCWLVRVTVRTASAVFLFHRPHLLHLIGRQDGLQLLLGAPADFHHLLADFLLGKLAIGVDGFHLLVAVSEDWLQLGSLVRG